MTLIRKFNINDNMVRRTYQNTKNGKITHVVRNFFLDSAGKEHGIGVKVISCDKFGNPTSLKDITAKRNDLYIKAKDGSTLQKIGDKLVEIPRIFNDVCALFVK